MEQLIQDVRYALRTLARKPGFVAVTLLTLMLGIGANLAIFTVVNAVLLRPLPIREPDRVVRIFDDLTGAGALDAGMSVPELNDIAEAGVFEQVSVIYPVACALGGADHVERIELLGTSPNYFELLGVEAALGRTFTQQDWTPGFFEGVVISDALWRRQFGADPKVIGRQIRADMDPYTIIGVMPPDFRHPGPTTSGDVDIWAAAGYIAAPFPSPPIRGARLLPGAIGRLKPGLSLEDAQQKLSALTATLQSTYPEYPKQQGWTLRLESIQASLIGNVRSTLVILMVAVSFVLLIVCVNVAILMLARSAARSREFAIRQSIGASRFRLARQLLTESLLLSIVGGGLALVVLKVGSAWLVSMMPADIPRLVEINADWRVALTAIGLSVLTGLLFGVAPAMHAARVDLTVDLKDGSGSGAGQGRRHQRSRAALVVAEVALSIVLLAGAGLLVRSFLQVAGADPGLNPNGLIAAQIWVPVPNNPEANRYNAPAPRADLVRNLYARISTIAGVERAALATAGDLPARNGTSNSAPFSMPDEPNTQEQDHAAQFGRVTPQYFEVLGTPIKRGRAFTEDDDATTSVVVVVNEAFVRRFSANKDPIGRMIRLGRAPQTIDVPIIGVAGDIHNDRLDVPPEPRVYFSMLQRPTTNFAVLLRTKLDVNSARAGLDRAVHDIDAELPVFNVRPVSEMMSESIARRRFSLLLMMAFAASALLLAALGIYGVVAFSVGQRSQEFGLRTALGAPPRHILGLAVKPGIQLAAAGAGVGLVAAFAATRLMEALLFGVSATDPITYMGVTAVLLFIALVACLIPARRATQVSPIRALRAD